MMKYFLFISSIMVLGCKEKDPGPVNQLVGTYEVIEYIVGKDTLISSSVGNVSLLRNPLIKVLKNNENMIKVEYYSNKADIFDGGLILTFSLVPHEEKQLLIDPNNTIDIYSGYASGDILYLDWATWDYKNDKIIRIVTISKKGT